MAKILYHIGTETYFGLDDDVVVIDLDECSDGAIRALYEHGDPNGVLRNARHVHAVIEEAD
jgi:hypothetical protein